MTKFRISNYLRIDNIDSNYDAIPEKYSDGYFIMYDENRDSEYLVNSTIKYYIDKFSTYKTEEDVLKEVEDDLQSKRKEIKETCSGFFDFLCKAKILVPENKVEEVISDEPLYKEGDTIDQYRIVNILSNRSYTDVYSVTDLLSGNVYVIKLLNRKKIVSATRYQKELAEMELEYNMLQKSRHISAINKACAFKKSGDDFAYLVLEYIPGKSLSRFIDEEAKVLTHADYLHIIESIISSFSSLHKNNIIHGDIHSSNILVTEEKAVKIIDLGMSRDVDIHANEVMKSGGVYFYMPPERINIESFKKFSNAPDLFSDVYQVGIIIYLVLYNSLPFDGFIWEELAQSIKEDLIAYPGISFLNHPVAAPLVSIIKRCLEKEPSKRYRDASAILEDFKKQVLALEELMEI